MLLHWSWTSVASKLNVSHNNFSHLKIDPLFLHLLPQQGSQLGPMLGLRGPPLLQGCGVTLWREVSNYIKQVGGWAVFRTWLGGL